MNIASTAPFKLYPVNKSQNNSYSYYSSSPLIQFEWNESFSRVIDPKSLRLCGKFRMFNLNSDKRLPSNSFDMTMNAQGNHKICYIDDRVSVSSCIEAVNISNMRGNLFEQCRSYNRNLSSIIPATTSYKDLCSMYQMTFASTPNNDCISRMSSSDILFCLPLRTGFLQNPQPLLLSYGGLSIQISLGSTANCLYGANAQDFVYEIRDVFMVGKYLNLVQPIKPQNAQLEYSSYYNFLNVMNSGNDHNNLNLNLSRVSQIYQNFIPSAWNNNYLYNGFSTPPLLEESGSNYVEKKMQLITFNRGAVRYPYNFDLDFTKSNTAECYQSFRSRTFLNSIYSFSKINSCLISPYTENVPLMVSRRQDWLKTPQTTDQGLVGRWTFDNATGTFKRDGDVEKSAHVFGIGLKLDDLNIGETQSYADASYNYSIKSDIDTTTNNSNIFCLSQTVVSADAQGNLFAQN